MLLFEPITRVVVDPDRRRRAVEWLIFNAQYVRQLPEDDAPAPGAGSGQVAQASHRSESASRYRSVDDRLSDAVLALVKLEAPHILGRRGIG
jgi:hypothetical protein